MLAGVAQEPDTPRGVDVRCVTARRTVKVRDFVRVVAGHWVIVEQAHPGPALEAIEAIPVESHVERIWIGAHDHSPPVVRCYSWATLSGHRSRRYSRLVAHDRGRGRHLMDRKPAVCQVLWSCVGVPMPRRTEPGGDPRRRPGSRTKAVDYAHARAPVQSGEARSSAIE